MGAWLGAGGRDYSPIHRGAPRANSEPRKGDGHLADRTSTSWSKVFHPVGIPWPRRQQASS